MAHRSAFNRLRLIFCSSDSLTFSVASSALISCQVAKANKQLKAHYKKSKKRILLPTTIAARTTATLYYSIAQKDSRMQNNLISKRQRRCVLVFNRWWVMAFEPHRATALAKLALIAPTILLRSKGSRSKLSRLLPCFRADCTVSGYYCRYS